jgi:DNA-binding NarL/FixJ family response regulator
MDQRVQVLIVDHEVHTRQGLQALLAAWPEIQVVGAAANGVEALYLVERFQPDVALMDILMPVPALGPSSEHPCGFAQDRREGAAEGADGLEVIRRIKSQWPRVRIIVLTMYTTHRAAALAAGADAFLLKGCPAEALQEAILKTGPEDHK